jgi:glycosyltransferase involved in cell wall biosynthesis
MRIAVVTDSMSAYGGAERVIEQLLQVFPDAHLFTLLDLIPQGERAFLESRTIQYSFLQSFPSIKRYYRKLLYLWPIAIEQFDVTDYDLVISSHHSVAYGVITRPGQVHVSYVHSPMRYAWDLQHQYLREAGLDHGPLGWVARHTLHKLRIWDYTAAQRPDAMATNSFFVAERLRRIHGRAARVIYPPVAIESIRPEPNKEDYYISVGRLVPYKRTELLVNAFRELPNLRLKVVGSGPEMRKLVAIAPPNVELLGFVPTEQVKRLLAKAKAFLFAGIEDFGIAALESQASGTPVIAYNSGGLCETISGLESPSPTGLFFDQQTKSAIVAAICEFESAPGRFSPEACSLNASRFSTRRFRDEIREFVEEAWNEAMRVRPVSGMQEGLEHGYRQPVTEKVLPKIEHEAA